MTLPPRLPKKPKPDKRWRSPAHLNFVRSHACCRCGSMEKIEAAHVRIGGDGGIGMKPSDWRAVSLCGGIAGCHATQHSIGERTFWKGTDVEALIAAFIKASPKRREIEAVMRGRAIA